MVQSVCDQAAPKCFYKCWGGVLCLMLLVSTVKSESLTMQDLQSILNSHNQSLMRVNTYLMYVDKFYHWYRMNHRHLDNLIKGGSASSDIETTTPPSIDDEAIQALTNRLQVLEGVSRTQAQSLVQQREAQTLHLSTLEAQIEQLKEQLGEKDAQVEELKKASILSNTTMSDLFMFIRQMATKSNSSIEELATNLKRVADQVDQSDSQIDKLETRVQAMEDADKLSLDHTVYLDETINSMQSELQHVINKTVQYDALQGTLSNLQSKAEQFEAMRRHDAGAMDRMERSLRGELSAITNTVNSTSSRTEESINKLDQDISEVKGSIQQSTTEYTTLSDKVNNLEKGSRNTNIRFESVQESLQMLGTKTSGLDTTIGSLQGSVSKLQSQADGLEQSRTTTQSAVNTLTVKVEDLAGEIKTVGERSAISSTNAVAMQDIQNKLEELEKKVNEKNRVRVRGDEFMSTNVGRGRSAARAPPMPSTLAIGG